MAYAISENLRNRLNAAGSNSLAAYSNAREEKKGKKNKGGFLGGLGYTLGQLGTGLFGVLEGTYDFVVGGIADAFGAEEFSERLIKDDVTGDWQRGLNEWYNPSKGMQFVGDVASGLGQTATYVGLNLIPGAGPTLSTGAMVAGAGGRGVTAAYQKTGKLGNQEWLYGTGSGLVEMGLEKLTGGVGKITKSITKSAGKEVTQSVAKSAVRSGLLKNAFKTGAGEFVEEAASEFIDPYLQRLTIDKNAENASLGEILRAGAVGFVSGAIGSAGGSGIGNAGSVRLGNKIINEENKTFKVGNRVASTGNVDSVLGNAENLLSTIDSKEASDFVAGNLVSLKASYDAYNKLSNKEGIRGKMLLGEIAKNIAYTEVSQGVDASKIGILDNAEDIAQYLTNKKGEAVTVEDIKNNKDNILTDLAIADFSAKMIVSPEYASEMVSQGKMGVLKMQSQYEAWKNSLTQEQLSKASADLGVDLSTASYKDFNKAMGVLSQRQAIAQEEANARQMQANALTEQKKQSATPLPQSVSLTEGETQVYRTQNGDFVGVKRTANGYTVAVESADGSTKQMTAKPVTEAQVNELIEKINENTAATETETQRNSLSAQETESATETTKSVTEESKVKQIQAKAKTQALTEKARALVKDFDSLPANTKARIREMIDTAQAFNVSEENLKFISYFMVRRGVAVSFAEMDDNGVYDTENGNRFIQLNGKNSAEAIRSAAIHEFAHDLRDNSEGYKILSDIALKTLTEEDKKGIKDLYEAYYKEKGKELTEDILNDELTAYALEKSLNNEDFLKKHLNENTEGFYQKAKRLASRIASWFKGKNTKGYQTYKALANLYDAVLASPKLVDGNTINADSNRLSIDTFVEVLGAEYEKGEDGSTILRRKDGTVITEVSLEDVKSSPVGLLINYSNISQEEKTKQYKLFKDMYDLLLSTQDVDLVWAVSSPLGFEPINPGARDESTKENYGKSRFAALTGNADKQYSTTIDFTTICLKTKAIIDVMSETMVKLNRGLTESEIVDIVYKEVYNAGEPVPCPVCYVFSRWVGLGGLLDSIKNYQDKYQDYSLVDLRKDVSRLEKEISVIQARRNKAKSDAKDKLIKELTASKREYDKQITIDKISGVESFLTKEEQADYEQIVKDLEVLDAWAWLNDVRLKSNYKPVPTNVLFNINKAQEFASGYPNAWKYRTTRGPAMGKAATPYAAEHLGQIITGLSVANLSKSVANPQANPFYNADTGKLTVAMQTKLRNAIKRVKAQNLLNGQRLQSTSDWRFEYGLDYLFAMLELQAVRSTAQLYTKVPEAVAFLASCGADVNCSLMPLGNGFDKKGNLAFSSVTGMDGDDAFALSKAYDNVQPIMVAISKEHLLACLRDKRITFVIPYHASGASEGRYVALMQTVGESVAERTDFSNYQTDSRVENPTKEQALAYSARMKILQRKGEISSAEMEVINNNRFLKKLYNDYYLNQNPQMENVSLAKAQAEIIFPYEYWDTKSTIDTASVNSKNFKEYCESLGIHPRFSGWHNGKYNADMDFSGEPNYWKLLIDRKMYANDGLYREQNTINISGATTDMLLREKAVQGIKEPSKINDPNKVKKITDKVVQKIQEKDTARMSLSKNEDAARGLVEKIKSQKGWYASDVFKYIESHPEINFIERLYINDVSVKKDLTAFLENINDESLLESFSYYIRTAYSDKDSHVNWDLLKREFPYRGAVSTFRNAVNKRIKSIMSEKVSGTNLEIVNGEQSLNQVKSLFDKLNKNEEIGILAQKVFSTAQKLGVNIRFVNKTLSSSKGVRGDQIADMVEYKTSFFNDTAETDQIKAGVILHELIHACTSYVMDESSSTYGYSNNSKSEEYVRLVNAGIGLNKIFDQIRFDKDFQSQYGRKSAKEMVAELSNPEFVLLLKKKNLWERIVDWLCNLFGFHKSSSAYEGAKMCLDYILDNADYVEYRKYSNKTREKMHQAGMTTFTSNNIVPYEDTSRQSLTYAPTGKTQIAMDNELSKEEKAYIKKVTKRGRFQSFRVAFTNAQAGLEDELKYLGIEDYEAVVQSGRTATAKAQQMIGGDIYDITAMHEGKNAEILSIGIDKVMAPIKKANLESEFFDYLFNLHNIDRVAAGKPVNGNTIDESKKIVADYENAYPEFKDWLKAWDKMTDAVMTLRVKAGLIPQERADELKKTYKHYVPTYREGGAKQGMAGARTGKNTVAVSSTLKKATGSTDVLLRPDEVIARQMMEVARAVEINYIANKLYEGYLANKENSANIEIVSVEKMDKSETEDLVDLESAEKFKPNKNTGTVTFYRDGKRITMKVSKNILTGFEAFHGSRGVWENNFAARALAKAMQWFKTAVTNLNPFFLIRNAVRDIQDAFIYTKNGAGFAKAYPKAWKGILSNNKEWQLYLAAGGINSSIFSDEGFTGKLSKRGFEDIDISTEEGLKKGWAALKKAGLKLETINQIVEQIPRFTEFLASLENGKTVDQALLDSADVTVNFGRSGVVTKVLNRYLIPFFNASVQGASKIYRTFTARKNFAQWSSLVIRCFILGIVPAILNNMIFDDDEEYQNLRTDLKENYFLFKLGNKFIKIPRGRINAILSGAVVRSDMAIKGEEDAFEGYVGNIVNTLTPVESASRTIFSPFTDVKTNTTWYGTAIEGREFENKAIKDRYDETTSSIAIWLGKSKLMQDLGYSPKKIHYLIDQYTGVIGDFVLPMTTKSAERTATLSNFTVDPVTNNKLSSKFYKIYDETTYKKSAGNENAALQIRYYNKVKDSISTLYKQKDEIQKSNLSDKEKLAQTRLIQVLINEAYQNAIDESGMISEAFTLSEGLGKNYSVTEVTLKNYKKLEESKESVGRSVITYNGLTTGKLYETGEKAAQGLSDMITDYRYAEGIREVYGTERALKEYNSATYEKAQKLNSAGVSYDDYYFAYMTAKQYAGDSEDKRDYVVGSIDSMGLDKTQTLMLIYALGYSVKDGEFYGMTSKAAKTRMARYIKSLKISTEEKISLAKACGLTVKNGKIITK